MKNVKISAICDTNKENIEKTKKQNNLDIPGFIDYEDFLEQQYFDFIDICTPGFTHYEICKSALKHGHNVIVEKPPCSSLRQFNSLKKLAEQNDLKFGVILNYRYKDKIIELVDFINRGKLGEIKKIQNIQHGPCVFNDASWLWNERKSLYLLYEFGIHTFDLQTYLCGPHKEIKIVHSTFEPALDSTTDIQAIIKYENGCIGIIDLTADSTKHSSFFTWMNVYGTGSDAFIRFFPPRISYATSIHNPISQLKSEIHSNLSLYSQILTNTLNKERFRPHYHVLNLFVDSIISNKDFAISLESVTNTMNLLEDIKKQIPSYLRTNFDNDI